VAVCNRRPTSTQAAARGHGIARTFGHWQDLVSDPDIDAVVVGTWPYLHCPVTLAALETGKHVLTEARMSLNAAEAHRMLEAADRHACQSADPQIGRSGMENFERLQEADHLLEMAKDVAAFLVWTAEPNLDTRRGYGLAVTVFLLFASILGYLAYRQIWRDAKRVVRPTGPLEPENRAKSKGAKARQSVAG